MIFFLCQVTLPENIYKSFVHTLQKQDCNEMKIFNRLYQVIINQDWYHRIFYIDVFFTQFKLLNVKLHLVSVSYDYVYFLCNIDLDIICLQFGIIFQALSLQIYKYMYPLLLHIRYISEGGCCKKNDSALSCIMS